MNIRDLEYFVALSEHRHFRKAAESCHVSQPTLSGQLRKLEDELGVMLLERTSRKVLFTQSGLILAEQARTILRHVQQFKEMASTQGEIMSGPLHIGLIPTLAPYLLPYITSTLHQKYPDLEIYLHEKQTHELVALLEEGQLDCLILAQVETLSPFVEIPLFREPMYLAVSAQHPLAKESYIGLADLKGETFLMLDDGHCLREHVISYCFHVGIHDDKRFRATSLETLRSMISVNQGITLFPKLAIEANRYAKGQIIYIPCVDPVPVRQIELVYRRGSPLRQRYDQIAKTISEQMTPILEEN